MNLSAPQGAVWGGVQANVSISSCSVHPPNTTHRRRFHRRSSPVTLRLNEKLKLSALVWSCLNFKMRTCSRSRPSEDPMCQNVSFKVISFLRWVINLPPLLFRKLHSVFFNGSNRNALEKFCRQFVEMMMFAFLLYFMSWWNEMFRWGGLCWH